VEEIRAGFAILPSYTVNHAKREGNRVAHLLAQHTLRRWEYLVRRLSMPEFVSHQVQVKAVGAVRNSPDCNSFIGKKECIVCGYELFIGYL
jgi:hypothetical protein